MEFAFEICYTEGKQNVLSNYLSRPVEGEVVEEREDGKRVLDQYIFKHVKEKLEMTKLVATISNNPELEESLETLKNCSVTGDDTITPVSLPHQTKKYPVKGRYLSRRSGTALRMLPAIQRRQLIITACHEQIGYWGIFATIEFFARTFVWPTMRRGLTKIV